MGQEHPLGTQGLPRQKEETSPQGTQEHPLGTQEHPLGTQEHPLGTQGLPQRKEETSLQGTQEHPRQKEETSPQGNQEHPRQREETSPQGTQEHPLGFQEHPLGTQGLPQQKEETSPQGTQDYPRQKEETSTQMKHLQQEEPPLLSENLLIGNRQLLQITQQHGRLQLPQIQQRFLPANVLMRVAALSTMVGANVLTSRRTSTGGGSPQSLTSQQGMFQASVAMQELPSKSVASA